MVLLRGSKWSIDNRNAPLHHKINRSGHMDRKNLTLLVHFFLQLSGLHIHHYSKSPWLRLYVVNRLKESIKSISYSGGGMWGRFDLVNIALSILRNRFIVYFDYFIFYFFINVLGAV